MQKFLKKLTLQDPKDPAVTPNNPKQTLNQSDLGASDGSITVSLSSAMSRQAVSSLWAESPGWFLISHRCEFPDSRVHIWPWHSQFFLTHVSWKQVTEVLPLCASSWPLSSAVHRHALCFTAVILSQPDPGENATESCTKATLSFSAFLPCVHTTSKTLSNKRGCPILASVLLPSGSLRA